MCVVIISYLFTELINMQRFDVFFKQVFSRHANAFLSILKQVIPEDIGTSVEKELPVEIIKGALRVDKIFQTNSKNILIIDFEETFTLGSYFEILTHTSAHVYSTSAYSNLLTEMNVKLNYLPILITVRASKKHISYFIRNNLLRKLTSGVYQLHGTRFFSIYLFVLSNMNLAEYMLKASGLCANNVECRRLAEQIRKKEFWDYRMVQDPKILEIRKKLLHMFGELVFLINLKAEYTMEIWRFSTLEAKDISKTILDSLLILFLREVKKMSAAQVLSKREKRELIEAIGIRDAIEAIGIKAVIDAVGIEEVIKEVGVEQVIDAIGSALDFDDEKKRKLIEFIKELKEK